MDALTLLLGLAGLLLFLLVLVLGARQRPIQGIDVDMDSFEEHGRRHPTYYPLISQAMSPEEFQFLAERGSVKLARRANRERQRIALLYLMELRGDFDRLLHLARVVADLSSEIGAAHEFESLRLNLLFSWRYQVVLWTLRSGLLLLPQLFRLSVMVSQLAARMETAMEELGERASLAAELASSMHGRGLDIA